MKFKIRWNLRNKIILPTAVLIIIGMAVSTVVSYLYAFDTINELSVNRFELQTNSNAARISDWLNGRSAEIQNWADNKTLKTATQDTFMGKAARKAASAFLGQLTTDYQYYESVSLLDKSGMAIAASNDAQVGSLSLSGDPDFQKAMGGELAISHVFKSDATGKAVFNIIYPVFENGTQNIQGAILCLTTLDIVARDFVKSIKYGKTGYGFLIGKDGATLVHPDDSLVLNLYARDLPFGEALMSPDSTITYSFKGVEKFAAKAMVPEAEWRLVLTASVDEFMAMAYKIRNVMTLIGFLVVVFVGIGVWIFMGRLIITPIQTVAQAADKMKLGDLSVRMKTGGDEIGQMGQALNEVLVEMGNKAECAKGIAAGDLRQDVTVASGADTLGKALSDMVNSLNSMVGELLASGQQVDEGARQISGTSQSLAQGATEQASSLEEISASMSEIGTQTKGNAENATQANQLAGEARDAGQDGARRMGEMVDAMSAISQSSEQIAKIIKTIDDIAFQTNLLALNAAVEAARAGKHGKGFAVVAQEVRSLAARSAKAAAETAELIEGSTQKVSAGSDIAEKTAHALTGINETVTKVADLVGEIAAASNEQAQGISQINQGLSQIDDATQQNTANAEETSAAAQALSGQATEVRGQLARFKLKGQTHVQQAPVAEPAAIAAPQRQPAPPAQGGWGQASGDGQVVKPEQVIALDDSEFGKY